MTRRRIHASIAASVIPITTFVGEGVSMMPDPPGYPPRPPRPPGPLHPRDPSKPPIRPRPGTQTQIAVCRGVHSRVSWCKLGGHHTEGRMTMYDTADLSNPAEMSTPELVREFVRIKQADARGELTTHVQHRRLDLIVAELRSREVLD